MKTIDFFDVQIFPKFLKQSDRTDLLLEKLVLGEWIRG